MLRVLVFVVMLAACPMPESSAQDVLDDETVLLQMPTLHQNQKAHARGTYAKHQNQRIHTKHQSHRTWAKRHAKHMLQLGSQSMPAPHDIESITRGMPSLLGMSKLALHRSREDPDDAGEATSSSLDGWPAPDDPDVEILEWHRDQVKAFKDAVQAKNITSMNETIAAMATIPVQLEIEEGVHELIFQVLRDYQGDEYQYLQQRAWRGLSDQSATAEAAPIITHMGGENRGIEFMVDQLLAHPFYYGYCADQLTVQYEILMCMAGLFLTDTNGTRGEVAIRRGLVPGIMRTLMGESDLIASQSTACLVLSALFWRHPEAVSYFNKAGAYPYLVDAMERFQDGDDTPFEFGFTLGEKYNVSNCLYPAFLMYLDSLKDSMIADYHDWKPWLKIEGV